MNDLPDLLDDASQPDSDWLTDPHALLAEGRHRVRRRRLQFAAGVAAAVVLAGAATAVVAPRLSAGPEPAKPDGNHSSLYVEERLPLDEVERRCQQYMDNREFDNEDISASPRPWVAGVSANGRAVPASESVKPIENRVGRSVEMAREGDPMNLEDGGQSCAIPQTALIEVAGLSSEEPLRSSAEFIESCSRTLGYDIAGWQQAAFAKDDEQWQAVFVSANGYAAQCVTDRVGIDLQTLMYDERFYDDDGRPIMRPADTPPDDINRYSVHPDCEESFKDSEWTYCRAVGMLSSSDPNLRIELTWPGGRIETVTATRGGFAYSVRVRTRDLPSGTDPIFPTRILNADGKVIWEGWQHQDK